MPSSVFLDCQDFAFGKPIADSDVDREFNNLFPLPFLPEALRLATLVKRTQWWRENCHQPDLVALMTRKGYHLYFEAKRDPFTLLPELRLLADAEFARPEPPRTAPMADRIQFSTSRMQWLLQFAGAPQMENYLLERGLVKSVRAALMVQDSPPPLQAPPLKAPERVAEKFESYPPAYPNATPSRNQAYL